MCTPELPVGHLGFGAWQKLLRVDSWALVFLSPVGNGPFWPRVLPKWGSWLPRLGAPGAGLELQQKGQDFGRGADHRAGAALRIGGAVWPEIGLQKAMSGLGLSQNCGA